MWTLGTDQRQFTITPGHRHTQGDGGRGEGKVKRGRMEDRGAVEEGEKRKVMRRDKEGDSATHRKDGEQGGRR